MTKYYYRHNLDRCHRHDVYRIEDDGRQKVIIKSITGADARWICSLMNEIPGSRAGKIEDLLLLAASDLTWPEIDKALKAQEK